MENPALIDDITARERLVSFCKNRGSTRAFARLVELSPCYISLMKTGKRPIHRKVAQVLGLTPIKVSGFVEKVVLPDDAGTVERRCTLNNDKVCPHVHRCWNGCMTDGMKEP